MKKVKIYKVLYVISALLLVAFAVILSFDKSTYNKTGALTSCPFSAIVLVRSIEFLLPSVIAFVIALIFQKSKKQS